MITEWRDVHGGIDRDTVPAAIKVRWKPGSNAYRWSAYFNDGRAVTGTTRTLRDAIRAAEAAT